jgi:hypothetical protein
MARATRDSPLTPAGKKIVAEDEDDIEIGSSNMSLKDPVSLMLGLNGTRENRLTLPVVIHAHHSTDPLDKVHPQAVL